MVEEYARTRRVGLRWIVAGCALIGLGLIAIAAAWLGEKTLERHVAACLFSLYIAFLLAPIIYFSGWRASVLKQHILADYHEEKAREAKAIAEAVKADRSWQGQPAESAQDAAADHARELAIEWLEASIALPCCPADGRKIAGWRELGWSPSRWQTAADTLRAETTTVVGGPPHKQGTYTATRWRDVGELLAAIRSGKCAPSPVGDGTR